MQNNIFAAIRPLKGNFVSIKVFVGNAGNISDKHMPSSTNYMTKNEQISILEQSFDTNKPCLKIEAQNQPYSGTKCG